MSIIKTGTFTTVLGGAAQNLTLGFIPSYFYMVNQTNAINPVNDEIVKAEWFPTYANGTGLSTDYTASQPAIEFAWHTANAFTPFITADQDLWIPNQAPYNVNHSTNLVITAISKAAEASITATHSFTSADIGVTWVTFSQVAGMQQINTLRGQITTVTSTTSFTVNINSTAFSTYVSGGIANVITGAPVTTQFGSQVQMTPLYNHGVIGLTLGTDLMTTTADVWNYYALLDTSANG
jgi:hypothetical protein